MHHAPCTTTTTTTTTNQPPTHPPTTPQERRNGIPALVVVGQDGSELCFNGASAVEGKGPAAVADWAAW